MRLLSILLAVSALTQASSGNNVPLKDGLDFLRLLDLPHPYCEAQLSLEIASEYFVEIANELQGRDEYNDLIRMYRKRHWETFDAKWPEFREKFGDSPLKEAAIFLMAQSLFERLEGDDPRRKDAERALREAALLYPKSTLAPVVTAGAAAHFIRMGAYQRALALYQKAEAEFPASPLACLFKVGVGEAQFLLQDWASAEKAFDHVSTSCQNPRLAAGALLRIADSRWQQGINGSEQLYEKVLESHGPIIRRYYAPLLHNLGEIKYRSHRHQEAKFYFDEFLHYEGKDAPCLPSAYKRLADIAFRDRRAWQEAAGLYFAVRDKSPHTDMGRFSYIHGLLIGLPSFARVEYRRRLRVIDEEIDRIKDETLRSMAYLEKGLALLDAGEKSAMDYLVRLNERTRFNLNEGFLAGFVREKLLLILQAEVEDVVLHPKGTHPSDGEIFRPVEAAYQVWLKGTRYETPAKKFYSRMILHRFDEAMRDDPEAAIDKLERWLSSPLWMEPDWEIKRHVGEKLAASLVGPDELEESPAMIYLNREKVLKPYLEGDFSVVWLAVALQTGNDEAVKKLLSPGRRPASVSSKISGPLRSRLLLVLGKASAKLKQAREMESAFREIRDEELEEEVLETQLKLYAELKDYPRAFTAARGLLDYRDGEERKAHLRLLHDLAANGKLWPRVPEILKKASELGLAGSELAPFHYLAGRAHFELSQCKPAIVSFENGLKEAPEAPEGGEARFRLGKCLIKEKRTGQAKKVWEDLIKRNTSFWSPLAQSEIKLLK